MKRVRYTKYNGDLASEMSMEDLLQALSEYLLDSGFHNPYMPFQDLDHTLDDLREALRRALESGELFDQRTQDAIDALGEEGKLDELIDKLLERMEQENFISTGGSQRQGEISQSTGQMGDARQEVHFEVTDKSLDFLGYKSLSKLLGSLGKSTHGRHDTQNLATGIETSGASRLYEFGDTLNLDTTATLTSAIAREGLSLPLNIEYSDLYVHQCDYQSSC